jgi:hypothetical protein
MAAGAHAQSSIPSARFVAHVSVIDPDTAGIVELDVFKARQSGGMFAIDSSFLENGGDYATLDPTDACSEAVIVSPFNSSDDVVALSDTLRFVSNARTDAPR